MIISFLIVEETVNKFFEGKKLISLCHFSGRHCFGSYPMHICAPVLTFLTLK